MLINLLKEEVIGKSVKEKLLRSSKKYSEDEENYVLYTKLSHKEICRNTEIYNFKKEGLTEE